MLRPGPDPLESLVVALAQIPDFGQNSARLSELLKAMLTDKEALHLALRVALSGTASSPSDRRAVILIDQAEEAFTVCRDKARRDAFLSNLLHAAWVESGATVVVFTVRDDSDMSDYPVFPTGSPDQPYFRAVPLGREELRRAIEKPAELVGLSVEPALVNLLLQDLYQQPGRLPLLQATLVRLWERREGRTLTVRAYEAIGGVKGVLFVLAEEAYGRLDPPGRQIFQDVLLSLASLGHLGRLSPGGFRSAGTPRSGRRGGPRNGRWSPADHRTGPHRQRPRRPTRPRRPGSLVAAAHRLEGGTGLGDVRAPSGPKAW